MIDTGREVCVCNSVTVEELVECIKNNDLKTMEELLANQECAVGDKCESCIEEGLDNDGFSLAMVLAHVKQGRL